MLRKSRSATIGSGNHYKYLRSKKRSENDFLRRSWVLDGGKSVENLDQKQWKSRKTENRFSMPLFSRSKRDIRESDYMTESDFSASLANLDRLQFGGAGRNFGTVSGATGVPEFTDNDTRPRSRSERPSLYHNSTNQPPTHTGSLWCLK